MPGSRLHSGVEVAWQWEQDFLGASASVDDRFEGGRRGGVDESDVEDVDGLLEPERWAMFGLVSISGSDSAGESQYACSGIEDHWEGLRVSELVTPQSFPESFRIEDSEYRRG